MTPEERQEDQNRRNREMQEARRARNKARLDASHPPPSAPRLGMYADRYAISIFCSEASHEGRTCRVAKFAVGDEHTMPFPAWKRARANELSGETWLGLPSGLRKQMKEAGLDEPPLKPSPEQAPPGRRDRRWRLECEFCGLTVEAVDDRFHDAMSKLRAAGVSELSLAGLASILR